MFRFTSVIEEKTSSIQVQINCVGSIYDLKLTYYMSQTFSVCFKHSFKNFAWFSPFAHFQMKYI